MAPPPSNNLPLLSFLSQEFLAGTESQKRAVAQKLCDAFPTYGWVYLRDLGISEGEITEMFAMSKRYFDRPLEAELKETLRDAETNQGYTIRLMAQRRMVERIIRSFASIVGSSMIFALTTWSWNDFKKFTDGVLQEVLQPVRPRILGQQSAVKV